MGSKPLVSILMNCFNGERYLREAIDSIISQSYSNWELIFWDNQSTDNSKAIFNEYQDSRLKYYLAPEHTDLGGGRARAFQYLTGDFIAILDTDDVWLSHKLESQLKLFADPEVGIVISDTLFFNESDERPLYGNLYPPEGYVFKELLVEYFVSLETLMLRKTFVERLSIGFDPDFSFVADFDLVLRTARISKLAICREVLAKWRVHETSDSWQSSISFPMEREKWIDKQISIDANFAKEYQLEISKLHSKNLLSMAAISLLDSRRIEALRLVLKTNFKDWRSYAIIVLCFIPFSDKVFGYMQYRRVRRLLR